MSFISISYAAFLPVVVLLYRAVPARGRVPLLLAASYVFYGAWDWRFLFLVWVSTAVDYSVGLAVAASNDAARRRRLLLLSIGTNLGILGFFKYFGFFVDSAHGLLSTVGLDASVGTLEILLPVGISFYTFQTMSYTIDVYRGLIEPERRLGVFALYVAFFPQLVAGPIERASRLLPQLGALPGGAVPAERLASGLRVIAFGVVQKVVIADLVAPHVNDVYADPGSVGPVGALVGIVGFSLQIYGDFAGYSNIARGTARLLGVELIVNFREPYLSRSITEFWRRWHISLSHWLRDYLYIPLGGNRGSASATKRNLLLTMLLGGLWHGAAWTFVVWGGLHGTYLLVERGLRGRAAPDSRVGGTWIALTFTLVSLTWIPFRARGFGDVVDVVAALGRWGDLAVEPSRTAVVHVAAAAVLSFALDLRLRRGMVLEAAPLSFARGFAYGTAATAVLVATATASSPFIYFQF